MSKVMRFLPYVIIYSRVLLRFVKFCKWLEMKHTTLLLQEGFSEKLLLLSLRRIRLLFVEFEYFYIVVYWRRDVYIIA